MQNVSGQQLSISGQQLILRNIDKLYFEKKGYKKADVIDYYIRIAPYLLPHLRDRPFSMIFFPDANVDASFYQKQVPKDAPEFVSSVRVESKRRGHIDYVVVDSEATLVYLVNKSVLEMHAWFSRIADLKKPDLAVLDLDPSGDTGFSEAVQVAMVFKDILSELRLYSLPKTSGASGFHIFIPIEQQYSFEDVQLFLRAVCAEAIARLPHLCTTERTVQKRGNKVYLDAVQCGYGKTLAMPYSMRVKSGALVSTPLDWSEVNGKLRADSFDIVSIFNRIDEVGDLTKNLYSRRQQLPVLS